MRTGQKPMRNKPDARLLGGLALAFFKIGAFTFGGGYAMIALLERECVEKRGWIDKREFLDMTAVAESTPGPIAINAATYIGYRTARLPGAAIATLCVTLPSFLVIYLISLFFDAFLSLRLVSCAFRGIQVSVVYLILSAGFKMLKALDRGVFPKVILCAVTVLMIAFSLLAVKFSSILFILLAGVAGLAVFLIGRLRGRERT